jgi:dTDP-4-dehydrorhamnose reductase
MTLLLTGASGQLGSYLLRELRSRGVDFVAWSGTRCGEHLASLLQPVDLSHPDQVAAAFRQAGPSLVVHAGAMASVADCLHDPARARRVNTEGSRLLAELTDNAGARLVFVSTDLVFDGERGGYSEEDTPAPLSIYGRSKLAAEQAVLEIPRHAVVRCSLLFGPSLTERHSFLDQQLVALRERKPFALFADEWRTPLSLLTAARTLLTVAESDFAGLLHLGGPERLSRLDMGRRLARFLGMDGSIFGTAMRDGVSGNEPRPRDVSLDSTRWRGLFPNLPWHSWEESLRELGVR